MAEASKYHIIATKENRFRQDSLPPAAPLFSYNYTYHYPWVKKPEVLLRRCRFDDGGYMELTDSRLIIFEDWKRKQLPLSQVKKADISFKRLIAPIIIGGIISPLGFVAAFGNTFSFWFSMAFFLIGILLFYYGMQGSYQVSVELEGHHFKFFVDEKNEDIESFIDHLNILQNRLPRRF